MSVLKIHHLNCGSMCPAGAKFFPSVFPRTIVCHCLLVETSQRLILVDTGIGLRDIEKPSRLGPSRFTLGPVYRREETAFEQVRALGYSPSDVTDLIPTHLDLDHAGGIQDFPGARVHIEKLELAAAKGNRGVVSSSRYRSAQFTGDIKWASYDLSQGESWNGFDTVREVAGLPSEILLVGLRGHTAGHVGVAVVDSSRTLLHAGDAYYHHNELTLANRTPLGLRVFQKIFHVDYREAMMTQAKLGELRARETVTNAKSDIKTISKFEVFCSHDPLELARAIRAK